MPSKLAPRVAAVLATMAAAWFMTSTRAAAQTETVLHNFNDGGKDGNDPCAGLIFDGSGNLYGTTVYGGVYHEGTVFKLTPNAGGGWTEEGVHSFGNGKDGAFPNGSLIFDAVGNLYGTTYYGGASGGYGIVFELKPQTDGSWTEEVLHNFDGNAKDGYGPYSSLIFDAAGNLYGTTEQGGEYGRGTAFELKPKSGGGWTEKGLHSFGGVDTDGVNPYSNLIFDASGNLYGTTEQGGETYDGVVFELSPGGGGEWSETILYSFTDSSNGGLLPYSGVVFDGAGNLYGTTLGGGANSAGTVFELSPGAGGVWTQTVLYSFNDNGQDGYTPYGGVIFDGSGNLYGTTSDGGPENAGVVFKLRPTAGGSWTETLLLPFNGLDGRGPCAGLIFDGSGNLYGTTSAGGVRESGVVFEITP
jgi:uncharacterized repeat protein (TIGR03803 family)